jgi:hypothetical protein
LCQHIRALFFRTCGKRHNQTGIEGVIVLATVASKMTNGANSHPTHIRSKLILQYQLFSARSMSLWESLVEVQLLILGLLISQYESLRFQLVAV